MKQTASNSPQVKWCLNTPWCWTAIYSNTHLASRTSVTPFPLGFYGSVFLITGCFKRLSVGLVGDASCRIAMSRHQRSWLLCSVPLHVMHLLISVYEPQKSFIRVSRHILMHIWAEVTVVSFSTKTTCRHFKTICSPQWHCDLAHIST